ncbi:MAG TPA: FliM/FliN family flagellar motor switch protein [Terriglobia bacterium]|nr:FliM/FliN family flagellar motor switch protein [Terriglobia bacterium]
MNSTAAATAPKVQDCLNAWAGSISRALGQVRGTPFLVEPLTTQELEAASQDLRAGGVWLRFSADAMLRGEQALALSAADQSRLVQILTGEPFDENGPSANQHRGALSELFRQVAIEASTRLSQSLENEIHLQFAGGEQPDWFPAVQAGFRLTSDTTPPVAVHFQVSPEFLDSLQPGRSNGRGGSREDDGRGARPTRTVADGNLGLLMDVELEVTLRFGRRQMLLSEILDLSAGSLVELDRQVQDPVELLVGKKVVALGEVVVADGNYGIRVTEIVSRRERMESLKK